MGLVFGDFELDPVMFELRLGGRRVPMEPQAFDVLAYLVLHRDRLVSKEELMDQIWGGRFVTESAVTSRIKQCRRAVGDDGRSQAIITTRVGRGYQFVAPVAEAIVPSRTGVAVGGGGDPSTVEARTHQVTAHVVDDGGTPARRWAEPRSWGLAADALKGRDDELALLHDLLRDAQGGHGRLVVVSGEPGIGKSALVERFVADAGAGTAVLTGRAVPSGGPYRPLAGALTDIWESGPSLDVDALRPFRHVLSRVMPGGTPGAADPMSHGGVDPVVLLGEGLLQLLALTAPLSVLVVEDAQHADPDTLAALEYLATAVSDRPVLIVVVRRDWPRPESMDRLDVSSSVYRLRLARLGDEAVGAIVDAVRPLPPEVRSLVVQRSEGLPVVAAELAVAMSAQHVDDGWFVPESISALIDARMVALTEAEQRLLAAAAVLGESPEWDLVPAVAEVDGVAAVAGLRRAVTLHLLVSQGGTLRWRHGLVQKAVWGRLLPLERRALGRAAASLMLSQEQWRGRREGGRAAVPGR